MTDPATNRPQESTIAPVRKDPAKLEAGKVESPKATPAKDAGISAKQIEGAQESFEEAAKLLEKGERTKDTISAAFGLWIGYPHLLELIGHNTRVRGPMPACITLDRSESSWHAYDVLNIAHYHATHFLMVEAKKCGLDPHPLFECGNVIRELYAHEPWRYYAGLGEYWPQCMGNARYSLPASQQEALRAGEAVFMRLAVELEVAADLNLTAQEFNAEADWRDVQDRLLRLRKAGEAFTSQRDLAERLKCSLATINKAVNDSASLKGWMVRHGKRSPKAQSLNDVVTDSTANQREPDPAAGGLGIDEVDQIMGLLIEQAPPKERANLNELNAEGRREMARLYMEQQAEKHIEDKARKGIRILGRKP
jgi:hypothetical protein